MLLTSLIRGFSAGLIATVPMTAAMLLMRKLLPEEEQYSLPPSQIAGEVAEEAGLEQDLDSQQHAALTSLLHFGYGAATGAIYAPIAKHLHIAPVLSGVAFGLLIWSVSYLGILPALQILPPATKHPLRRNALMIVAHCIWGAVLGQLTAALDRR